MRLVTIWKDYKLKKVDYVKAFAKVFFISLISFSIATLIGSYSYVKKDRVKLENNIGGSFFSTKAKEVEYYSTLDEGIKKSEKVNFLILGMEDVRTDTIILASFSPELKKMDLINIPRDTYIHRKGYNDPTQRKINSIYQDHGVKGVKKAVSYILGDIPIHHHVILDYEGVRNIVDGIGGIEVDVPFHMKYEDPTSKPPLKIDIGEGKQLLDGESSLEFLRYRKGNNNGYVDGDLGRIKAQQDFIGSFISKASDNILTVIRNGFGHVKTDISLMESISYGSKAIGMTKEDFILGTLPGKAEFKKVNKRILSYYIYDRKGSKEIAEKIYNVKKIMEEAN